MLELLTVNGCQSSKRLKEYLKEHDIPFLEKPFYTVLLDYETFKSYYENYKEDFQYAIANPELHNLDTESLYQELINAPSLLKRPIILGASEPNQKEFLHAYTKKHCSSACANWSICGLVREGYTT